MMSKRLQFPLQHIKPSMPMPSGGITAGHVEKTMKMFWTNIMTGSSGGKLVFN
jgi:ribulose 1,5-bisphosphate carboxylase large subunit-like protein